MARYFRDRRCPNCGWLFTPTGTQAIRCLPCHKEHRRVKQREYDLQQNKPMPLRERICICGQAFASYNAKRCPACKTYRYADVPHVWHKDLLKLADDPDWRKMSLDEWHQLNDEMEITMRRAQAELDAEKELVAQAHNDKKERLTRILGSLGTNV